MADLRHGGDAASINSSPPLRMLVRNLTMAAQKLSEPASTLFERLYLRGEDEGSVRTSLRMTSAEFEAQRSTMLRSLMTATTQ